MGLRILIFLAGAMFGAIAGSFITALCVAAKIRDRARRAAMAERIEQGDYKACVR